MESKTITTFLIDGETNGLIKCTIGNWIGIAYKIPKSKLEIFKERGDGKKSGVYFLFGASNETGKPVAYIGQAGNRKNGDGILNRLLEHKRNADKNYWNYAVFFTTADNYFGQTEISFLENQFCSLAIKANRYEIKNGNDPAIGHITEEKEAEMNQFIENARLIMWALSIDIFDSFTETQIISPQIYDTIFYLSREIKAANFTVKGIGKPTAEGGFIVLKGSKISPLGKDALSVGMRKIRQNAKISEDNVLLEDMVFSSPSGAACFVIGNTCNGWRAWKNKDGVELRFCKGDCQDD